MTRQTFQSAFQHHQAGQLDQAEALYRQILGTEPANPDAIHLLGVIHFQRGQLSQGETLIRQAIALRPEVPDYYHNLAKAMIQSHRQSEAIACLRQVVALQPGNHSALFSLAMLLAKEGQLSVAIETFRTAAELRPDNLEYRGALAAAYGEANRPDLASVELREATRLAPEDARFWHNLGSALCQSGNIEEGLKALDKSLQLNPALIGAHCNKAVALRQIGRHEDALAAIHCAAEIDPNARGVQNNLGALLCDEGNWEEALMAWRLATIHEPNEPGTHWNLSRLLLRLGYFADGWEEFEWRLKVPGMRLNRGFSEPQWDGSDPHGKTILLYAEGGFGDAIHFIRLVPRVTARGGRWLLECQPELVSLLEGTAGVEKVIPRGGPLPRFDMQIPLQGLPRILKITLDTIPNQVPYLQAPADRVERWAKRVERDAGLRVGLVWAGSKPVGDMRTRSVEVFAPLAAVQGVKFFSLQKGPEAAQAPPAGMDLIDYTSELGDFADTAALMQNMDLVISVDTSAAHLAGALARPIWVVIPFVSDFRWLASRSDSPWYPTMRLFREPTPGDSATPIAQMVQALREFRPG